MEYRPLPVRLWRLFDAEAGDGQSVSNAVKFTNMLARAVIEIGCLDGENEVEVFVRDNGAGFDMEYVDKLFGVFPSSAFPGTV